MFINISSKLRTQAKKDNRSQILSVVGSGLRKN